MPRLSEAKILELEAVAEALFEHCPTPLARVRGSDQCARTAPDPTSLMDDYGIRLAAVLQGVRRVLAKN